MIIERAGFDQKHLWMKEVTSGNISVAYKMYKNSNFLNSLIIEFIPSFRLVGRFFYNFLPVDKLINKSGNDSLDLAPELILFWSKSDHVGLRLIVKLIWAKLTGLKPDLRCLFWYAHWLGFQGYSEEAKVIFEKIRQSSKLSGRLEGEFYSLYGNLEFSLRNIEKSIEYHLLANDILEKHQDKFFLLYNLGISAKSYVLIDNSTEFKKDILFKYDELDPDEPDPRFGMRILIYLAYLYSQEGEVALADLYLDSSDKIYLSSTSEIDKSVYSIYRALILFSNYEFQEAFSWLNKAQVHLDKFGKYRIYQDQINEIREFFSGKAGIKAGILYHFKTSSHKELAGRLTSDWNETFVKSFYEITQASTLEDFRSTLEKISVSQNIVVSQVEKESLNQEILVDVTKSHFSLSVPFLDEFYNFSIYSDVKKWRHELIFENIQRTLVLIKEIYTKKYNDKLLIDTEKQRVVFDTNKQLAHDIRSPLAALDSGIKFLENTTASESELIRSAINRIHDIANNLVGKNEKLSDEACLKSTLLTSVITSIMSEKRTEFRDKPNINIDFFLSVENYGLFSNIIASDLKRIISNLINNSVEAIGDRAGSIKVNLISKQDMNIIHVEDTGGGMKDEIKERIFEKGFSNGKEDGTGFGLFHAKETIESWQGVISCNTSSDGVCTFSIELPVSLAPANFVTNIGLEPNSEVVVVDDDISIHGLWRERISSLSFKDIKLVMFSSPQSFLSWLSGNSDSKAAFFIDYEFLASDITGIDLLEKIPCKNKFLATSHIDESHIQDYCAQNSIGLIDKGSLAFLPIQTVNDKREAILIDDDPIIHMGWEMEAKEQGVKLTCYKTIRDFLVDASKYDHSVAVFIDSDLGDSIKGEIESEKIYNLGFKNLYLATGHQAKDIEKPKWIKSIVGKRANFNLIGN